MWIVCAGVASSLLLLVSLSRCLSLNMHLLISISLHWYLYIWSIQFKIIMSDYNLQFIIQTQTPARIAAQRKWMVCIGCVFVYNIRHATNRIWNAIKLNMCCCTTVKHCTYLWVYHVYQQPIVLIISHSVYYMHRSNAVYFQCSVCWSSQPPTYRFLYHHIN